MIRLPRSDRAVASHVASAKVLLRRIVVEVVIAEVIRLMAMLRITYSEIETLIVRDLS